MICGRFTTCPQAVFVVGTAVLLACGAGFATVAAAQSAGAGLDNLLASPSFGIPQAPVGHRQPHQADLPQNVLRDEQGNSPTQNNPRTRGHVDRGQVLGQPSICVGC